MRAIAILAAVLTACGGSGPAGDDTTSPDGNAGTPDGTGNPQARYEPWATGNAWSYTLTDPVTQRAITGRKTTVMGEMDVGGAHAGQLAFLVHVERIADSKDIYETFEGDLDVRYKSVFYDAQGAVTSTDVDEPYRLKLDESAAHTQAGVTFQTTFTEVSTDSAGVTTTKSKSETWQVVSASEPVTVTAGSFMALHLRRTSAGGTVQDYWYVRGVGKVKETGSPTQDEELESFTPAS